MRRLITNAILLTAMVLISSTLCAESINVSNGDDLQAALDTASGGDEVIIAPGTYGSIELNGKNYTAGNYLVIRSDGTGEVIIDGPDDATKSVNIVSSSYIALENLTIRNGSIGINVEGSQHILIRGNKVSGSASNALWVGKGSHKVDIIYNKISDSEKGVMIAGHWSFPDSCSYIWMEGNQVSNCGTSNLVEVREALFHFTLKDNIIYDGKGSNAVYIKEPDKSSSYYETTTRDVWIDGNVIYNTDTAGSNGIGILTGGSGVNIINNVIYNNSKRGISGNNYADLGLPIRVYNNTSYNNGDDNSWENIYINSNLSDATTDVDPGNNPNTPDSWYYTNSVTGISLDQNSVVVINNDTITLVATIAPSDASNKAVKWSSSDESIAKVNQFGEVTTISFGTSTLTATSVDGSFSESCTITYSTSFGADTIYVNEGDDLQSKIDLATEGTAVIVSPGTYDKVTIANKNFTSTNPLIIKSDGSGDVIIKTVSTTGSAFKLNQCSYVIIEDLTFEGGLTGVLVEASDHIVLKGNEVRKTGQAGVHITKVSSYVDVVNNYIHHTGVTNSSYGEGIYVGTGASAPFPDNTENVWIEGNVIHDCGNGEALNVKAECFHVTVKGNTAFNIAPGTETQYNQSAITVEGGKNSNDNSYRLGESRDIWIESNQVYNVKDGYANRTSDVGIMFGGIGVVVKDNLVHHCKDHGIYANNYEDMGITCYLYNNTLNNNSKNLHLNNFIDLNTDVDPGNNPNMPQSWYEADTFKVRLVDLSPATASLTIDQELTLIGVAAPYAASDLSITYSSSDDAIAAVDANGVVTAMGEGTATITATSNDGGHMATSVITVDAETGITNNKIGKLSFYPNTLQSEISQTLYFELPESESKISIINANGQVILKTSLTERSISIENITFQKGLYIIRVETNSGFETGKLLVY